MHSGRSGGSIWGPDLVWGRELINRLQRDQTVLEKLTVVVVPERLPETERRECQELAGLGRGQGRQYSKELSGPICSF